MQHKFLEGKKYWWLALTSDYFVCF